MSKINTEEQIQSTLEVEQYKRESDSDEPKSKIISINEYREQDFEGYKIETTKGDILVLIERGNFCCEEYGCSIVDENGDDLKEEYFYENFQGVEIKSVGWKNSNFCGGDACVEIITDKDTIIFKLFNYHNGYYSHEIILSIYGDEDRQEL